MHLGALPEITQYHFSHFVLLAIIFKVTSRLHTCDSQHLNPANNKKMFRLIYNTRDTFSSLESVVVLKGTSEKIQLCPPLLKPSVRPNTRVLCSVTNLKKRPWTHTIEDFHIHSVSSPQQSSLTSTRFPRFTLWTNLSLPACTNLLENWGIQYWLSYISRRWRRCF